MKKVIVIMEVIVIRRNIIDGDIEIHDDVHIAKDARCCDIGL